MDVDAALEYLRSNHRAVMATTRADGTTQMTPITVGVDGDDRVDVSSRETAYKVRHRRGVPSAALCAVPGAAFDERVPVAEPLDIVPLPGAMDPLVYSYRGISGEPPDWHASRAARERARRVILRMPVERAGPTVSG